MTVPVALARCENCGRTFLPEKLVIHNRSCTSDKPARAVNDPVNRRQSAPASASTDYNDNGALNLGARGGGAEGRMGGGSGHGAGDAVNRHHRSIRSTSPADVLSSLSDPPQPPKSSRRALRSRATENEMNGNSAEANDRDKYRDSDNEYSPEYREELLNKKSLKSLSRPGSSSSSSSSGSAKKSAVVQVSLINKLIA